MGVRQDPPAATTSNEPWPYFDFWGKHGPLKLLTTSANRGWRGLAAQLCSVGKAVIPWRTPDSDIRICVDVRGNRSVIERRAPGIESRILVRRGAVWLSPPGLRDGSVDISEDMTGVLHIYLPLSHFSVDESALATLGHTGAFEDSLLAEMASAVTSELEAETSAGRLLIESLASGLAARLVQKHIGASSGQSTVPPMRGALDRRRLQRVLDYIETNLESDLNLDLMASIACLSRYHFARAFRQAVGQPPHRYVSARRLERAKALLKEGDRSLVDIALSLNFSSQANFTRAFTQATGYAPGQFRQGFESRQPVTPLAGARRALPILA